MNKIKVVISGIHYPMTMMVYFIRAFDQRKDVELVTAGPFTGSYIPWMYGMHVQQKYVKIPDIPLPKETIHQRIPSSVISHQLPWIPDLFIQVDAGWFLSDKPKAGIVAHIQTDPHVLKPQYAVPKSYSDLKFCMQDTYREPDEIYLPYAADETLYYPMPEVEKIYDACLIGLQYPTRNELVGLLRGKGLNIKYTTGEIFDEYRLSYNQSKVALNWSTLLDVPCRFFEGMALGLPVVSNIVPDQAKLGFIEGEDFLGFNNVHEGADQVVRLLHNVELCNRIAKNGYTKVLASHLWSIRAEQILKEANLI